jgi:hypothetical protein
MGVLINHRQDVSQTGIMMLNTRTNGLLISTEDGSRVCRTSFPSGVLHCWCSLLLHRLRPPSLNNPAAVLFRRFQWERQPGDLEKSLVLVSDGPSYDHPERLALLDNFANELTRTVHMEGPMPRLGGQIHVHFSRRDYEFSVGQCQPLSTSHSTLEPYRQLPIFSHSYRCFT